MIDQISDKISDRTVTPYQDSLRGKPHVERQKKIPRSSDRISDVQLENKIVTAIAGFQAWRETSYAQRAGVLANAAKLMHLRVDDFALPVTSEMGQLYVQSCGEILLSANIIDYCAQKAQSPATVNKSRSGLRSYVPSSISGDIEVAGSPVGIVFGVQPLNFPYYQLARFAAPHLMAGNVVMLKHIGCVPLSAIAFERLWLDAGAPEGAFTNLLVSPEQMHRIIDDPRVRNPGCLNQLTAARCA
ncbi:hypothetical protein BH11PSE12_BH11PSE12_17410 [soil metagenome]